MQPNYTEIAIVLDKSGSMGSIKSDTIGGFNSFIEEQKDAEGKANLTLVQFSNKKEITYESKAIDDVESLTSENYTTNGGTALLDAIGSTIDQLGKKLENMDESERPSNVLFIVITDGYENSSVEYNRQQIVDMIQHQEDVYNWKFMYFGANQDAIATGGTIGFSSGTSVSYAGSNIGQTFASLSSKTRAFRTTGDASSLQYNDQERLDLGN